LVPFMEAVKSEILVIALANLQEDHSFLIRSKTIITCL